MTPSATDIDPDAMPPRAAHRRPVLIMLVLLGGAAGTAAREGLSLALGPGRGTPTTIWAINILGALLLGLLLESLARRGPDEGRRQRLRLLLGTGFLGGFTTYSSLATGTAQLVGAGTLGGGSGAGGLGASGLAAGIGYATSTVLVGAVASALGIWLGARLHGRQASR